MKEDIDAGVEPTVPVWPVFGDLMSVLLGAFVLVVVGVIGVQLELSARLDEEVKQRQEETQRRVTLEEALAVPLAAGRVTLINGRIGISGNVLFALNSAQLQPEGREILKSLIAPLSVYLETHQEVLMVSGFTDDQQVRENNRRFADNWELSAQRALTVTRVLIDEGIAPASVFAAAFGSQQPVSSNADEEGRAKNRRVEIAPIPKPSADAVAPATPAAAVPAVPATATSTTPAAGDAVAPVAKPAADAASASPAGAAPNASPANTPSSGQAPSR